MKILLADPPLKESYFHANFPNLGILYLIGSLRRAFGESCQVGYPDAHRGLKNHLDAVATFRPDLYGLSFAFFTRRLAYATIREVKARFPRLPVVCGGPMPSAAPAEVLENSEADICVRGEGETAIAELARAFRDGPASLDGIPGIVLKDGRGGLIETAKRPPLPDIDAIPFPAWDAVDLSKYKGWHIRKSDPQAHILVSRGCPFNCVYCSNPVWKYAKPWLRLRSPADIAAEVRLLHGMGVREIYLSADEFNTSEAWTLAVCEAIEGLGLKDLFFNCNIRPDPMTPALARAFRRINLWVVHLGIETGNQATLDGVGKKVRLDEIVDACRILKAEGVKVFAFVMLYHAWEDDGALRWETTADVDRTLAFCRKLLKRRLVDYMSWQVATAMPGARLWDLALKHDLLPERETRGFFEQSLRLPGLRGRDVRKSLRKGLWLKSYYTLRNGNVNLRHLPAAWANLRVMLGLGPPRGAH